MEPEEKSSGSQADSEWKVKEKPSDKLHYVPPRLIEYGDISDLRRAGKEKLADLFKQDN